MNVHNYIKIYKHVLECAYNNKYYTYTAYYTDIIYCIVFAIICQDQIQIFSILVTRICCLCPQVMRIKITNSNS